MNLRDRIARAAAFRPAPEVFEWEPAIGFLADLSPFGLECDAIDDVYAVAHDRELPRAMSLPRLTETDPE